jgi:EmrB/QacA subfamily drug resistance transporter
VDRRRWVALVILLIAGFMDMLDVTIVNVTIPSMLTELHAGYAQIEWVVAGYVLGFAALLITGGRLGDIYGRKRVFLAGVAGFTVASALCGVSANAGMLIGSRFFQGAMAGLMVPQIIAIIHAMFDERERGKALGVWGGVLGSASAAGLILGGVLVEGDLFGLGWRPIFLVNVPIGLAAIAVAAFAVRDSRSADRPRLDPIGVVLATAGILALVYPLTEGRTQGWPLWTFVLLAAGLVLLAAFVAYEWRRARTVGSPLLVLGLFRVRAFSVGMVVWLAFWVASGAFFLVWTLYLQVGLGWSPLRAGLTGALFAVGGAAGAGLSVQLFTPRYGRKVLMAGALLNAAGFAGYSWAVSGYGPGIHTWQMAVPLLVTGFGFGLVVAPMIDLVLTGVPVRDAGSASGLLSTIQQVGLALGVALVGVLFFNQLDHDSGRGVDAVTAGLHRQLTGAGIPAANQDGIIAGFRACVHDRSAATDPTVMPPSCRPGGGDLAEVLTRAGVDANAHNFSRTFGVTLWYPAALLVLVFVGMFALPHRMRRGVDEWHDASHATVGVGRG